MDLTYIEKEVGGWKKMLRKGLTRGEKSEEGRGRSYKQNRVQGM